MRKKIFNLIRVTNKYFRTFQTEGNKFNQEMTTNKPDV